jgi:uncharacterized protein YciI
MYFVIVGRDRPGAGDLRLKTRSSHRDYIHGLHQNVVLALAGPLLALDGQTMTGSLLVVEAKNRESAEQFSLGDPYRKVGLFADVQIDAWNWVTGNAGEK